MDNTASCMIEVCDLHKHYKDVHVLRGISTTVAKGEVCAVIGPSGSGKSTFLRCLNRLEEASSGEIFINAQEITDPHLNLNKMRENIGMVFQGFNLFPHMTAIQNIMLAPVNVRGLSHKEAEAYGMELLSRVGLADKHASYPDMLSGGQQQRVAIARALITKPKLVFADEPTGNLDSVSSAEVLGFLKRSVNELGQTIVMVTHDAVAASYADRAIVFSDGRIVADEQHPNAEVMNELLMAERERTTRTTLTDTPADQMAQMAGVRNVPDLPITDAPLPPAVPTSGCEGTLRHARAAARHAR